MNLGPVTATAAVQLTSALFAFGAARVVPKLRDSARTATIHLLLIIVLGCFFFPSSWSGEELIGVARLLIFMTIQLGLYAFIWFAIFVLD